MPDHGDRSSDAVLPVTIIIFPGASLMDIPSLAVGMTLIRCPGCGASLVIAGTTLPSQLDFVHGSLDCPILARIETALALLENARAVETN